MRAGLVGAVEDEEVEVPLDDLDTATLRRQAVVDEAHHELHPGASLKRGQGNESKESNELMNTKTNKNRQK